MRRRQDRPHPQDRDTFWLETASVLDWITMPTKASDVSWKAEDFRIKWFEDGVLNACAECLDRHLATRGKKTAFIWEGDDPEISETITYEEVFDHVCRMANVLKARGVDKGDRVVLYMPMVPEAAYAMLACARIGAIHSVVFGGFSPEALASRINDCGATAVITADEGRRGGKTIPLKANVDRALEKAEGVRLVLTVKVTGGETSMVSGRDLWWHEMRDEVTADCPAEPMAAEDPLFILYTSGSTGKPKGVIHSTGGYLVYVAYTFGLVFDIDPDKDIYWCTADVGWITGHSYMVYGPLARGATSLLFEGVPTYPDPGRLWSVTEKHNVTILYTAPTAIRALMKEGDGFVKAHDRSSLRLLGSVGEPINPEAWRWYHDVVGEGRCPIVDTWWQTETGGIMITPLPDEPMDKPGWATAPLPGIELSLVDQEGHRLEGDAEGLLLITAGWPGQARGVYGDPQRFIDTYFSAYPGTYFTGDGAHRDAEGDYRITGRVDDVLNVSGHRMGTAEIESALVAHPAVAEAAVVGYPHDVKGQGIHCYVILQSDVQETDDLPQTLRQHVRQDIGPVATPDRVQIAPGLPKTRSGKIMRRILRKIAEGHPDQLGDTSTLAEPEIVDTLVADAQRFTKGA
ncbi:acetyl-CoA synthetase [Parvularcula bermudensis HTCC2503]|uniref:Acetate--CoA ligase n=1 Tax=Parvularcula bermudensis (strain ATCC BAA-594 / HTCC2503 / KCTC 12087) TaxID=314260 RepID=E0TCU4_PARBH|nr:acetate--CoA ligase [Parvularcula bermudensis]ADM09883.1 acetyl-CoA synthetase [Parvularcula bermudensis HTCC2503]